MPETDPELAAMLDAEYREFVRSLHKDTIGVIVAVESWWDPACLRAALLAGAGEVLSREDRECAHRAESDWRCQIHPQLLTLINGHPDPDVRQAADVLDKRTFALILIFHRPAPPNERQKEENKLAIGLIHDGLKQLRRAAYHAPFRVHRPEPDWDGVPTGNKEGMAHDILARMKDAAKTTRDDPES
jgi:hypothetical protein